MDSEKSINLFEMKKGRSPNFLRDNFFLQFVNNFSSLLL